MTKQQWTAIDEYVNGKLIGPDPVLEEVIRACDSAGLPSIGVTPNVGRLLQLLAQLRAARRILEIGTLGGYSTIWLARGLAPDGRIITLEAEAKHAEVARRNFARAKVDHQVELRLGPALQTLAQLEAEGCQPFDLIFIDADKRNNPGYLRAALNLSRSGSLILIDNTARQDLLDESADSPDLQGTRAMFDLIAAEPRLTATAIQTVGIKGYDGFTLALVR